MKIKKFEELNENSLDDYYDLKGGIKSTDIYAIYKNGMIDIDAVYINKSDAEKKAKEMDEYFYNYYRKLNKRMSDTEYNKFSEGLPKHKVITLDEAVEQIKENIHDGYDSHNNPSY